MRYIRFLRGGAAAWGVVQGEMVFSLRSAPYDGIDYDGESLPLAECRLLAPCAPGKIVCVGKNYYDHAVEMGGEVPDRPILFLKGPNTLNHPEGAVSAPGFVTRLDYEGELAFVVRRRAKHVSAAEYGAYILGYTCANDVTARDIQQADGQWTRGKSMDGFCPVGPHLTDEVDPAALAVETRLNGAVVQRSNTSLLMHSIPALFEFITAAMTLEPGDLVLTGTPAGIGPMSPGDRVEVEIEGIGVLGNTVAERW